MHEQRILAPDIGSSEQMCHLKLEKEERWLSR